MESDSELSLEYQLTLLKMLYSEDFESVCTALVIIGTTKCPSIMINYHNDVLPINYPGYSFRHHVRYVADQLIKCKFNNEKYSWVSKNRNLLDKLLKY